MNSSTAPKNVVAFSNQPSLEDQIRAELIEYKKYLEIDAELRGVMDYITDKITEIVPEIADSSLQAISQYTVSQLCRILELDHAVVYLPNSEKSQLEVLVEELKQSPRSISFEDQEDSAIQAFQRREVRLETPQSKTVLDHPHRTHGTLYVPISVKYHDYGLVKLVGTNIHHLNGEIQESIKRVIKQLSIAFSQSHKDQIMHDQQNVIGQQATENTKLHEDLEDANVRLLMAETMAERDHLTGIRNHKSFVSELKKKLEHVIRGEINETPLTFVFFDINGMSKLNSIDGHDKTDKKIIDIAHTLDRKIAQRDNDEAGRRAGDEFELVCFTKSPRMMISKIRDELNPILNDPDDSALKYSIGTCVVTNTEKVGKTDITTEHLLRITNLLMYIQKHESYIKKLEKNPGLSLEEQIRTIDLSQNLSEIEALILELEDQKETLRLKRESLEEQGSIRA